MTQKLIISKDTYNVLTESEVDNLIFSSDYNTLKYYVSGNVSLTITGDGTLQTVETTVSHNLGYIPFFIVYVNDPENTSRYNIVPYNFSFITIVRYANAYSTTTQLIFQFKANYTGGTNRTVTFYYKIFKNNTGL